MPPFRSPHHTISEVALVGGGSIPHPGEISLAHHGVLFLDELPEFKKTALEVLRQPLEDGCVHIARARMSVEYPARFILVSSMNPCPCGYFNHPEKKCTCSLQMVQKYLNKVSGPLMDRIDIHIEVQPLKIEELQSLVIEESSAIIQTRVEQARLIQQHRFKQENIHLNAQMLKRHIREYCAVNEECQQLLALAMRQLHLSARAYDRILKLSRTIADLAASVNIDVTHLAEAIHYRSLDRQQWFKE